jgi:hypothetical protein
MPDQRRASLVAVTVYIDRDLKNAVRAEAAERGETVTAMINRACLDYTRGRRQAKRTKETTTQ